MAKDDDRTRPGGRPGRQDKTEAARRRERLSAALKENLRRRKAQARARTGRSGGRRGPGGDA